MSLGTAGYIRTKLDIKLLILCFLSNLQAQSASFDDLTELSIIDGAVDYFDFCSCLSELVEGGQVVRTIPDTTGSRPGGMRTIRSASTFFPSVRRKAELLAADVVNRRQRNELIHCSSEQRENGDTRSTQAPTTSRTTFWR